MLKKGPVALSGANGHGDWMARNDYEARQGARDPAAIWLAWLVMRYDGCRLLVSQQIGLSPEPSHRSAQSHWIATHSKGHRYGRLSRAPQRQAMHHIERQRDRVEWSRM